jgi:adenosylmethionine---8-amino-7-oxononanoate aminotransferase
MYPAGCAAELRRLADRFGLSLTADETATGFGRTGNHVRLRARGRGAGRNVRRQGLTGGYVTLAAVLCSSAVAEAITRSPQRVLLHGPTFMANPLACVAASAARLASRAVATAVASAR